MSEYRLIDILRITGAIEVVTGLRVGGSQETMEISGLDNPIIRNPANAQPFIPGSSIRGRMRSLAEWYFAEVPRDGNVTRPIESSDTGRVFGLPAKEGSRNGPTRLIIRDALLSDDGRTAFENGRPISEVKSENSINRLTAMANPRPMERVLPGVTFGLEFVYRIFDLGDGGDRDRALFDKVLLPAMALLELDALGGGGSRGNGKIRFVGLRRNGEPFTLPTLFSAAT